MGRAVIIDLTGATESGSLIVSSILADNFICIVIDQNKFYFVELVSVTLSGREQHTRTESIQKGKKSQGQGEMSADATRPDSRGIVIVL